MFIYYITSVYEVNIERLSGVFKETNISKTCKRQENEKEWYMHNYTSSNFNWNEAKKGYHFFTTNKKATLNKYKGRYESIVMESS